MGWSITTEPAPPQRQPEEVFNARGLIKVYRMQLLRWGGEMPLRGRVERIEPAGFTKISALGVEEQRVSIIISLLDPPARYRNLGDGFRVEAQFQVWHADAVLTIPVAALFRDGGEWAVYAVEDGRARLRRLTLGQIGEESAEVRAGLRNGARVILYPGDAIREGLRVAPEDSVER